VRLGGPPAGAVALRCLPDRVVSLPDDVDSLDASAVQDAHVPVLACYFKN